MATQSECKARDPKLCRYHGALLVMEEAAKKGDVQKWLLARDEVAAAAKKKKIFHGEERTVPEMPSSLLNRPEEKEVEYIEPRHKPPVDDDYHVYSTPGLNNADSYIKSAKRDSKRQKRERAEYLQGSEAVPTPMEAYALWLTVWEDQQGRNGKKISHVGDYPYENKARVFGEDNTVQGDGESIKDGIKLEYNSLGWKRWTPTNGNERIPAGYGSMALDLFIMPDVVPQHLGAATSDHRKGWEFGHTTVYVLERDSTTPSGYRATTNAHSVTSFKDVEEYRRGRSVKQLVDGLSRSSKSVYVEEKKELG